MNKEKIVKEIIRDLQKDLQIIIDAAKDAHTTATHEETKAASKYDTFALEASYLAQGQAKRSQELEQAIKSYQSLSLQKFKIDSEIGLTALITLEKDDGSQIQVFLGPAAGGKKITLENTMITVITPQSPIGQSLIGKQIGDTIEMPAQNMEYEIVNLS